MPDVWFLEGSAFERLVLIRTRDVPTDFVCRGIFYVGQAEIPALFLTSAVER